MLIFLLSLNINAQQTPAPEQTSDYTIVGATAHIGNGEVIENSLLLFSKGKIKFIGKNIDSNEKSGTIINANGKHLYPGFIILNATLGLGEINAVAATLDQDETGEFLPHVRSIVAYNAESKLVEVIRPNGVLMGQITPLGGRISGASTVVQFDAWNWEDAIYKVDEGIHINWPRLFGRRGALNKNYQSELSKLSTYFSNAQSYLNGDKKRKDLQFEAINGLFSGEKTVYIHANAEKEIVDAISFLNKNKVLKMVLVGGLEAYKTTDLLLKNDIPVVLNNPHMRQYMEEQSYDFQYEMARKLVKKGITVSISGDDRMNSRNLPFYAGTFAAFGLDKEKAIELITLNAAKILGIENEVGSLEVGKDATLFISEGDALDMRTNKLTDAFIQGRKISLESHQTKLWKRYSKKYNSK